MAPTGITDSIETLDGMDVFMIQWDFAESGSSFFLDVTSMTNTTTGDSGNFS